MKGGTGRDEVWFMLIQLCIHLLVYTSHMKLVIDVGPVIGS